MVKIACVCRRCGNTFYRKPSVVANGRGVFCNWACQHPYNGDPADWFPPMLAPRAGCLVYTGPLNADGYGQLGHFVFGSQLAHRLAWLLAFGAIPDGLLVLHRCDNPPCCLPAHLWLGTDADNTADMDAKGRRVVPASIYMHGSAAYAAKLTDVQVESIRHQVTTTLEPGSTYPRRGTGIIASLAREYSVSVSTIRNIVRHRFYD